MCSKDALSDLSIFTSSSLSCLHWQVFEELEEIGKTIQDDLLDAGMPVHGTMGGDISKCPYYAAKMGIHQMHHIMFPFIYTHVSATCVLVDSLSGSGVWWNGICRPACDGCPQTPYRTSPVRHLVCRTGWTGSVVSDVSQPSRQDCCEEGLRVKHAH